jgi:hypothetical protein
MNAKECEVRSQECAENAALTKDDFLAVEFLKLAAQWRAMAVRENFLCQFSDLPLRRKTSGGVD